MEKYFNPFYKLKIFDRHEVQRFEKGRDKIEMRDDTEVWKKFNWVFDIHYFVIADYGEYVLFESKEDTGTKCVKVNFQNGMYTYAAYSLDTFEKWLQETYTPVYSEWDERVYNMQNQQSNNN